MWIRAGVYVILLAGLAGCTGTPPRQSDYAEPVDYVGHANYAEPVDDAEHGTRLAALDVEANGPVRLPVEEELSGPHQIDFYVQIALERNPEILAARRRVAAQAEVIPQVTSLPDPMLMDTFMPITENSVQTAAGRGPNTLGLSQAFPWLSKLRVQGEVAEQETNIALSQLSQTQLEVVEEVHLAYYEIHYHQRAVEITLESEERLQDLVKYADARFGAGGSEQDALRARVELEKLRDQLITLRRQLRVSQADLAKLLHASPELLPQAEEGLTLPPTPEAIDQLYELAVRCRPELQQRLHAIVRDQRARELARLEYYPDVTVGVAWQAITTDGALSGVANGRDNVAFGLGVNLPIWRDRLRAGVREAEHRVVESARRYDATRDDTFRLIRRLIAQADAYEQQITLFRERIIPRAEQTLRVSIVEYRAGKVDFLQVIDNWTELLFFQIQLTRLQANLGQALASLQRVIGCEIAPQADDSGPVVSQPPPSGPAPNGS